jgi:glycosyltransferase involved in cell wall biosynthesis
LKVAIVIPAHNEAGTIQAVVTAAAEFGSPIVVDDGSSDHTDNLAGEAGAQVVRHNHNRGYDAALQSGFEKADALGMDIVVTLDADGQHDPSIIAILVSPLESGEADLVIGVRASPPRLMERVFGAYTRRRYGVPDILCGAKAYAMGLFRHHGVFDSFGSIGTELAIASLQRGVRFDIVPVAINRRADQPRFGGKLRANGRILRALAIAVWRDKPFSRNPK